MKVNMMNYTVGLLLAGLALLAVGAGPIQAQEAEYPVRPVKIMIGFPVGGLIDIVARVVGDKLTGILGQPFIIEARPGATGMLATAAVAKSDPDGYTLLMANDNHALNPSVFISVPYNSENDFAFVGFVGSVPMIFTASNEFSSRTVQGVVNAARSKPGAITYASIGVGSQSHLAAEMFSHVAGIKMQHVPYRGGAPAINDLMAGHVNTMFLTPVIGVPMMRAGNLAPLATAADARLEVMPDVPTMAEAGYPVDAASWLGLVAPAGTPPAILAKLEKALGEALAMPDVRRRLIDMGTVVKPLGGKQFGEFVHTETARWAEVVAKAGIERQ
jgi:tripartite-type tricarboxylate transporter receptor subunit TctC